MVGKIIMLACMWVCAGLFLGFGLYARRRKEPMWFWAGEKVPRQAVTDVPAYNRAHSRMFVLYSLPWWLGGLLGLAHPLAAAAAALLACTGFCVLIRLSAVLDLLCKPTPREPGR